MKGNLQLQFNHAIDFTQKFLQMGLSEPTLVTTPICFGWKAIHPSRPTTYNNFILGGFKNNNPSLKPYQTCSTNLPTPFRACNPSSFPPSYNVGGPNIPTSSVFKSNVHSSISSNVHSSISSTIVHSSVRSITPLPTSLSSFRSKFCTLSPLVNFNF